MEKTNKIMDVSLPVAEAADLTNRAARAGVPLAEYLGFHVLSSAYGRFHPVVQRFNKRAIVGVSWPEIQEAING